MGGSPGSDPRSETHPPRQLPSAAAARTRRGGRGLPRRGPPPQAQGPLKVLSARFAANESFRDRFLTESELAASIDHPNIVPIYEAGEADGSLFIAMRYVEGTDLRARLRDDPVPPAEAIDLLSQVGSALDLAHTRGLVGPVGVP